MAVMDKEAKTWILLEGTVCQVGKIKEKTATKQEKYNDLRRGIKEIHKDSVITQINIVFDFLGGYNEELEKELKTITKNEKEKDYLIRKCQKWVISQNAEIRQKSAINQTRELTQRLCVQKLGSIPQRLNR